MQGAAQSAWLNNRGSLYLLREWKAYDDLSSLPRCMVWLKQTGARLWFEQALKPNSLNERAQLGLGRAAWLEGKCDEAVAHWNQALAIDSQDIFVDWEIANALYADGHTLQAVNSYRKVQAGPYFFLKGLRAASKGDHVEAVRSYELSVALQATRDSVQTLAAEYLDVKHQPAEAKKLWLAFASTTQPDDPDHWWALGQAAEIDQQWAEALANYDKSIALQTHPYLLHIAYLQAGMVSMRIPNYTFSERYLRSALALQPQNLLDHLRLGELATKQGHYDSAHDWYQEAARIAPTSELPAYYQGVMLWETGDKENAWQAFLEADKKNPHNPSVKFYLGLANYDAGKVGEAIAFLEEAIKLYSGVPVGWMSILGDWYAQAGRCQDGRDILQRILESSSTDGDTQRLADILHSTCP